MKEKRLRPITVAGRLSLSEPALRSWLNGNRQINLVDFFRLCAAAMADPRMILFGSVGLTPEQKQQLGQAVVSILENDTAVSTNYPQFVKQLQNDIDQKRGRNK